METIYDRLNALNEEFTRWCAENNLPPDRTADELLYQSDGLTLNAEQHQWLITYIDRWNNADKKTNQDEHN